MRSSHKGATGRCKKTLWYPRTKGEYSKTERFARGPLPKAWGSNLTEKCTAVCMPEVLIQREASEVSLWKKKEVSLWEIDFIKLFKQVTKWTMRTTLGDDSVSSLYNMLPKMFCSQPKIMSHIKKQSMTHTDERAQRNCLFLPSSQFLFLFFDGTEDWT